METITTDVIIRGPATHGRTGETYYEAWLPLRSPAQEYIKGTPVGSGPTPYAAMKRLASKYPWSKEGGPLVSLEFAGPVADKVILDYHTCEDSGKTSARTCATAATTLCVRLTRTTPDILRGSLRWRWRTPPGSLRTHMLPSLTVCLTWPLAGG